jgi:hypothetical protein
VVVNCFISSAVSGGENKKQGERLGVWGCVALGSTLGVIAGLLTATVFSLARTRLWLQGNVFPGGETSVLVGLCATLSLGGWASAQWAGGFEAPDSDVCTLVTCLLTAVTALPAYFRLIRDHARRDALAAARR